MDYTNQDIEIMTSLSEDVTNLNVLDVTEGEHRSVDSTMEEDSFIKESPPVLQKRLLTWLLPKRVPPIPSEDEVQKFPRFKWSRFFEALFFWQLIPLYNIGYKRTIEDLDLWDLNDDQKVEYNYKYFDQNMKDKIRTWQEQQKGKGKEDKELSEWPLKFLVLSLYSTFKTPFGISIILAMFAQGATVSRPMVMKKVIEFVEEGVSNRHAPMGTGIGLAILFVVVNLASFLLNAHVMNLSIFVGVDIKSLLIKLTFEKAMYLSPKGKEAFPVSKISSLVGNDLSRLEFSFLVLAFMLPLGFTIIAVIALLIYNIGPSSLVGIAIVIIAIAAQMEAVQFLFKFRNRINVFTDARVSYIREVLNNFKIIKFYNWEEPYFERINDARKSEMSLVLKIKFLRSSLGGAFVTLPMISTMATFLVLYKVRGIQNVAALFSSLSLFSLLSEAVSIFPQAIAGVTDAYVALKRVHGLLLSEELVPVALDPVKNKEMAIELEDASFVWESLHTGKLTDDQRERALELQEIISNVSQTEVPVESLAQESFQGFDDLNFSIRKGEFVIITGVIGSGKTSLLSAIAGIMTKTGGELRMDDSSIFCGTPWVQNASVKENILFGHPYDEQLYNEVIKSCALVEDLRGFENGDATEVGERGVTLSGGQKARINLARAVYAQKEINLFDDVLSAVDSKVGNHIIQNCFLNLMQKSTRLLATHQLSWVGLADRVIFLEKDGTVDIGTAKELKARNADFAKLLSFSTEYTSSFEKDTPEESQDFTTIKKKKGETLEEEKAVNALGWGIYKAFFFPGEGWTRYIPGAQFLGLMALTAFVEKFSTVWLSFWSEVKFENLSQNLYMGLYIAFNGVYVLLVLASLITLSLLINNASKSIVIDAIKKLLGAPMWFMDVTPLGRVLNRFTRDAEVLDNEIFQTLMSFTFQAATFVATFVLTFIYLPWAALSLPVIVVCCLLISDYSQSTGREVKRLESLRTSFVFNNVNESLSGMDCIRAHKAEKMFISKNNTYLNRTTAASRINFLAQRWLTVHLSIISTAFILMVSLLCIAKVFRLSPASIGVLLSSLQTFDDNLISIFRSIMLVENSMNSAERLHQYSNDLVQEAPMKVSEFTPNPKWPANPSIDFKNVSMSYRPELPLTLKSLSFHVNAREKIGICGRTGAGKSSIMNALFRITELSSGKITIDGLDISKMGLLDLRRKLSIIPQETVLFGGTIRYNLDPFGMYSDDQLYQALVKSGLASDFDQAKNPFFKFSLDNLVEDDGINFSLGEKQLIALARALARDSNILILDEATSSVDYETDSKIQAVIKNEFKDYTVLCIAHRLKTILDYDRVLVMDAGEVVEFDKPLTLFRDGNSVFHELCTNANVVELDFNH